MSSVPTAEQIYIACAEANSGSVESLLVCLTQQMMNADQAQQDEIDRNRWFTRNMFVLFSAALSFFMQGKALKFGPMQSCEGIHHVCSKVTLCPI